MVQITGHHYAAVATDQINHRFLMNENLVILLVWCNLSLILLVISQGLPGLYYILSFRNNDDVVVVVCREFYTSFNFQLGWKKLFLKT